jgi:hypothetical protein
MNIVVGLLGALLVGAEGVPKPASPIRYQVRVYEMEGLDWRGSLYARLQPVARQGSATIWTASRDLGKPLAECAARLVIAPQILGQSDSLTQFSQRTNRRIASRWTRHADGPVDHAVAVAYTPEFEDLGDGCQFAFLGRKLDQGVLAKVVVEDVRVAAVHRVMLTETVQAAHHEGSDGTVRPKLEVPEVVKARVEGEWLIPSDGILLVSLGANTAADGQGKAVVRERLVLIEADTNLTQTRRDATPSDPGMMARRTYTSGTWSAPAALPLPLAPARMFMKPSPDEAKPLPMPVPAAPSRSLPLGRAADGSPVPLPPLPEEPIPPTSLPDTSEPCATPQSRSKPEAKTLDPASAKASFNIEAKESLLADPMLRLILASLKPMMFRVPLTAGLTIEIEAAIRPTVKP